MQRTSRALVAATVLAVALSGCGQKGGGAKGGGPPPLAVDVSTAQRKDIATFLTLDGQIAPLQEATLSTPQSGTVTAVYVNEGQRVSAGTVLAKLDDATLRAQLAQQQAIVLQGQAHLGSSTLQGQVAPAQSQSTVINAQQQVQTARNGTIAAKAALDNAKLTYDSDRSLLAQGYVSQTQYEQARSQYVSAQQTLANAQESERQAQAALRTAQAQGSVTVPAAGQAIAADRATLQAAQAQVQLLQTQIAQTTLVAPFSGVVTQRLLDPGAFASPNQPIVRLSQIDTVYVNVNVPDESLGYVKKGTPVTFTTPSLGNRKFTGTVFDVNAVPTAGTLSYRARVQIPNPGSTLRGGMLASVTIQKERHPNALVVPRTAVFQTDQGANVFTVVDAPKPPGGAGGPGGPGAGGPGAGGGRGGPGGPGGAAGGPPPPIIKQAKVVPVQIGLQTDTETEITGSGLAPGTPVITTRPDALQDKSLVMISAPAGGRPGGRAQ